MNNNYNHELMLVHQHIKKEYEAYMKSNRIKDDEERRRWGHSIQTLQYIASNCNITDRTTPVKAKKEEKEQAEFYNTIYES